MKNIYVPKSIAILFLGMAAIAVGSAVAKTVPANNLSQAKGNAVAGTAVVAQVQTVFAASSSPANVSSSVKKRTLADGSLQITLVALQSEYPDQTYVVKSGEQLYFVEASAADDSVSEDHAPADDRAILVSASGVIL